MERELKAASKSLVFGGGFGGGVGLSFYVKHTVRTRTTKHTSNESTSLNKKLSSFLAFPFNVFDVESAMYVANDQR